MSAPYEFRSENELVQCLRDDKMRVEVDGTAEVQDWCGGGS